MTNTKNDNLSYDILAFLQKVEPKRIPWNEIVGELYPSYKFKYASPKNLGVAVSQKLKILLAQKEIVKENGLYGTMNSRSPKERLREREIRNSMQQSADLLQSYIYLSDPELFEKK